MGQGDRPFSGKHDRPVTPCQRDKSTRPQRQHRKRLERLVCVGAAAGQLLMAVAIALFYFRDAQNRLCGDTVQHSSS